MAATRSLAGSTRTRPSEDSAHTASPVTARVVAAPAGMRAITRLVSGVDADDLLVERVGQPHSAGSRRRSNWPKPSGPPASMVAVTRFRFPLTMRTWPRAVATQAAEESAAIATGAGGQGDVGHDPLAAGVDPEQPAAGGGSAGAHLGAGGDPDRVAGRAHRDGPGERPAQRDLAT